MIAADGPAGGGTRLLSIDAGGAVRHCHRRDMADLFRPGDLVIANEAATLPASLSGTHRPTGAGIEVRLAAWSSLGDPRRFTAVIFGAGDFRARTEDRPPPPSLAPGDRLDLGPLEAEIERTVEHPRLASLRFPGERDSILAGLARHGRPIQYAHVPAPLAMWDMWTAVAARPLAFEPPSAGFSLDWQTVTAWRRRGIGFATLEHAAGLSSTGDPTLDRQLPFDEAFRIPAVTAAAIDRARAAGGRIVAIGTTVVRALESAIGPDDAIRPGEGVATGRITGRTRLKVVDMILSGVHEPGESHFDLLSAFADSGVLSRMGKALRKNAYRTHEFGDFVLLERKGSH